MINNALAVGAVHKLRFAQDIILYNLDLTEEIEGFDGQAHIATWQDDPIWQGDARERRAADRARATGPRRSSRPRSCSSRWSASCSAASS